jgi:uncharacterized lipoprotein YajG
MKYIITPLVLTVLASGCASNPHYPKNFTEPTTMHRTEVIQANRQCIQAKMKPNIEYLAVKTEQGRVITPINVHCDGTYQ